MDGRVFVNCCNEKPIIDLAGGNRLCKVHFSSYFEEKVQKTIRHFAMLGKEEKLGVAVSGGKDSLTVLYLLKKIAHDNPRISVHALTVDEGIAQYREHTVTDATAFCEKYQIPLTVVSYKTEFGFTLDEMLTILKVKPCTICGVFRRYLLNKKSRELGFTKIATGHNLDDECQSILMNQFRNTIKESARLGPISGVTADHKFIPRIKPLYLCTEKEVATYAYTHGLLSGFNECPNVVLSQRAKVRDIINDMESHYAGAKNGIVNSFLELLPDLKKKYGQGAVIGSCKVCGEPAAKDFCKACFFVSELQKHAPKGSG